MKKQTIVALIFISSFALTGCIEDLLSSLCNRLAGSNSIISIVPNTDFVDAKAVLTYINTTTPQEPYVRSDCKQDFQFPKGDRNVEPNPIQGGRIIFVSALDEEGLNFFSNSGGLNGTDKFQVSVLFYANCDGEGQPLGEPAGPFVSDLNDGGTTIDWALLNEELIPPEFALVGECSITGNTGTLITSAEVVD
jgi:hypothetical protein